MNSNNNNNANIDPANNDTLAGAFRFIFSQFIKSIDTMLPARVIKFDRATNRVQVELLIAMITTDGSRVSRAQIASIPVFQIGGGNFFLNFNLNTGDLGWVIANDRDISNFLQTFTESSPNTYRVKNFADAVFFPNVINNYTISPEDEGNAVLQNLSGTVKISLGTDSIVITAPSVTINGDLKVTGELLALNGIEVSGGGVNSLQVTGNERVIGNITASGNITPNVP